MIKIRKSTKFSEAKRTSFMRDKKLKVKENKSKKKIQKEMTTRRTKMTRKWWMERKIAGRNSGKKQWWLLFADFLDKLRRVGIK